MSDPSAEDPALGRRWRAFLAVQVAALCVLVPAILEAYATSDNEDVPLALWLGWVAAMLAGFGLNLIAIGMMGARFRMVVGGALGAGLFAAGAAIGFFAAGVLWLGALGCLVAILGLCAGGWLCNPQGRTALVEVLGFPTVEEEGLEPDQPRRAADH